MRFIYDFFTYIIWLFWRVSFFISKPSGLHGSARWMSLPERFRFLKPYNSGLRFSRFSKMSSETSYNNLCLIAPTGSGKTTRFVIPNILTASGSVVVTDPSGEIFRSTSGYLASIGYDIRVFQPADIDRSLMINPMTRFTTAQERKQLATTLAMNTASAAGDDKFWVTMARNLLSIAITAVGNHPEADQRHLGNVRMLLNGFGANGRAVAGFMKRHCDAATFAEYVAFCSQDHRVLSSILSTARAALDLWSDPSIVKLTSSDTLDVDTLRKRKTAIYIIVPEHRIPYFSIIINLVYAACFEHCINNVAPADLPVYFFLDEFGNLGFIPDFPTIATTLRKRRSSLNIILQDDAQLRERYGQNGAQSILAGGMGNKLFFAGLDYGACHYVENVLGHATEVDKGTSTEVAQRTVARPLLTSAEIRQLPRNQAILISGRLPPVKIKIFSYLTEPKLRKRAEMAPVGFPDTSGQMPPMLNFSSLTHDFAEDLPAGSIEAVPGIAKAIGAPYKASSATPGMR